MVSPFTLRTEELNANFIETIKNLFANREIEIIVQDVQTDTDYLLKSPENRKHLLQSIANLENSQKIHVLSESDL